MVVPHGCVEPRSLFGALGRSPGHPGNPPTIYSGLSFGDYAFLGEAGSGLGGLGAGYRYVTWQVGPKIRDAMRAGQVGFLPLRFRDIPRVFGRGGRLAADVALIQCTPPRAGKVNLGISCSIFPAVVAAAKLVIAEVHPDMPSTAGPTEIDVDRIDLAVDASGPLGTLAPAEPDLVDEAIIERVLGLLPEAPCVQLGVGAVPDAILGRLAGVEGIRLHSGMLSDGLAAFLARAGSGASVLTGELAGTEATYRVASADPRVELAPTHVVHDVPYMSAIERFVSINSALEVDLTGQVNGEAIAGHQVSGVGGCLDFVEAARYSPGGLSVIALRSTARGRSRIVTRLAEGTPVTVPRFAVDVVVTEHGVARLSGLDLRERAAALLEVASPSARAELSASPTGGS